jgi:hypothetical protein
MPACKHNPTHQQKQALASSLVDKCCFVIDAIAEPLAAHHPALPRSLRLRLATQLQLHAAKAVLAAGGDNDDQPPPAATTGVAAEAAAVSGDSAAAAEPGGEQGRGTDEKLQAAAKQLTLAYELAQRAAGSGAGDGGGSPQQEARRLEGQVGRRLVVSWDPSYVTACFYACTLISTNDPPLHPPTQTNRPDPPPAGPLPPAPERPHLHSGLRPRPAPAAGCHRAGRAASVGGGAAPGARPPGVLGAPGDRRRRRGAGGGAGRCSERGVRPRRLPGGGAGADAGGARGGRGGVAARWVGSGLKREQRRCLLLSLKDTTPRTPHQKPTPPPPPVLDLVLGRFPADCDILARVAAAALDQALPAAELAEREEMLLGLLEQHQGFAAAAAAAGGSDGATTEGGAEEAAAVKEGEGGAAAPDAGGSPVAAVHSALCGHAAALFQGRRYQAAVGFYTAAMGFADVST